MSRLRAYDPWEHQRRNAQTVVLNARAYDVLRPQPRRRLRLLLGLLLVSLAAGFLGSSVWFGTLEGFVQNTGERMLIGISVKHRDAWGRAQIPTSAVFDTWYSPRREALREAHEPCAVYGTWADDIAYDPKLSEPLKVEALGRLFTHASAQNCIQGQVSP